MESLALWQVTGLVVLAALAVAVALAWGWVALAARALRVPSFFDEVHPLPTADGYTVVLCRLRPRGPAADAPPVVLCHGLAMNRRAFALFPDRCFARALAATGRDVWAIELRGSADAPQPRGLRQANFDTYAALDIPFAIAQVRAVTGAAEVDWVGFSMGGMLAYAHLGARGGQGVRRLVTIGSPVHFRGHPIARGVGLAPLLFAPARALARTPFRFLSRLAAPLIWAGVPHLVSQGLRGEHYSTARLRRVLANALSDVPTGVSMQFVRWIREGRFDSDDRAHDYLAGLANIAVPTLVIAGSRDRLALPDAVTEAARRIPAPVAVRVVGKGSGAIHHYDHLDLILGERALDEVFPLVQRWLDAAEPTDAALPSR